MARHVAVPGAVGWCVPPRLPPGPGIAWFLTSEEAGKPCVASHGSRSQSWPCSSAMAPAGAIGNGSGAERVNATFSAGSIGDPKRQDLRYHARRHLRQVHGRLLRPAGDGQRRGPRLRRQLEDHLQPEDGLGTAKGKFNFVGEAGDWVQGQSSRVHGTEPTWSSARERPRETSPGLATVLRLLRAERILGAQPQASQAHTRSCSSASRRRHRDHRLAAGEASHASTSSHRYRR
jgi:hypothetical protein